MTRIITAVAILCVLACCTCAAAAKPDAKALIKQMTLEEKAHLVVGMGMRIPGQPSPVVGRSEQKVPGAAGTTYAIPRLKIPTLVLADGPAGVRIDPRRKSDTTRTFYATGFPVSTLLASSWDEALVEKVGAAFGNEVLEYGVDILLAPGMNIQRNPLGGRNFEYYSEDPLVTGRMAASFVKGVQSKGVGTSVKHFAANNQESNRNKVNTIVSERALREIYLKGFETAVKAAGPWTVMSSYNKINGVYTSESADLLTGILRNDWKYDGIVMTDWWGGTDPVAQMNAGNDLIMPGMPPLVQKIIDAVNAKTLSMDVLDRNVERILRIIFKTPAFKGYAYSNAPDLTGNAVTARTAATQGMVLLKNESHALPLQKNARLALFGNNSYELIAGGTGSGDVHKAYLVPLADGCTHAGFPTDDALKTAYMNYIAKAKAEQPKGNWFTPAPPVAQMMLPDSAILVQAAKADAAIITIGRNAGEGNDRKLEGDYYLTSVEQELIKRVAEAFHAKKKSVTVVLNIGGVIEIKSWRDQVDAILLAWQPGQEGGNAICDVLSGSVTPSGKLAVTFPADYKDVPSASSFPGVPKEKPDSVVYEDGIFVGYRYYSTFGVQPAYEFGYGLSYTTFSYGALKLSAPVFAGAAKVSVTITNTGRTPGREIAQLYVSAPGKAMQKPAEELRAFAKTRTLKPGESQVVTFALSARDLSSFDMERAAWVVEPGAYTLKLGASSSDIRQSANVTVAKEIVAETVSKSMLPLKASINEMKK